MSAPSPAPPARPVGPQRLRLPGVLGKKRKKVGPPTIDAGALRKVVPTLSHAQADLIARGLGLAMARYGITTKDRAAMFVAQCAHESAAFSTGTEFASGRAYEGRRDLGNVRPGDGVRFKGRGRIMITGRHNYTHVSKAFRQNFVASPERLGRSPWSELASAWWWKEHGLNQICDRHDKLEPRLLACTKRINGGFNGLDDRRRYLRRAMAVKGRLVPR
jgi:putative chitinase